MLRSSLWRHKYLLTIMKVPNAIGEERFWDRTKAQSPRDSNWHQEMGGEQE